MSDNQLYNRISGEIKGALKEGLDSRNFSGLNEAISNSVNMVIDEAQNSIKKTIDSKCSTEPVNVSNHKYASYSTGSATRQKQMELEKERELRSAKAANVRKDNTFSDIIAGKEVVYENGKPLPTKFRPVGKAAGTVKAISGGVLSVIFGIITIAMSAFISIDGFFVAMAIIFGMLFCGSVGLFVNGYSRLNLINRARRFVQLCGNNQYNTLSQMSDATGISEGKIAKQIRKILSIGMYPEGYIDDDNTTLMLSDSVYKQYVDTMTRKLNDDLRLQEERKSLEVSVNSDAASKLSNDEQKELEQMITAGNNAISRLHALNDSIPGEVISEKLDRLENILKQIFNCVKEHPEQMDRMHKLMDYYLPTMLKLVEAYDEYDKVSDPGRDIIDAKSEIEKTLDTINDSFVKLLNNLFEKSVLDVTSDAKVLKVMLAQEGL